MPNEKTDIHATIGENDVAPIPVLEKGTTVAGKYVLVECLGQGGMGQAWEGIVRMGHSRSDNRKITKRITRDDV